MIEILVGGNKMLNLKHHFFGKLMLSAALLLSVGGTSVVAAATGTDNDPNTSTDKNPAEEETTGIDVRKGKGTWTIDNVTVYGGGTWSKNTKSNFKKTNGNYASFNGDSMPAALGYVVKLVNNKNSTRSNSVDLGLNYTTYAGNNSGLSGYHYWTGIRSNFAEPNTTTPKLHFSADTK